MVAIITQARVNSSRLPNKIFKKANGISFLAHHIARLRETGLTIIVATTNNGSEKPIVEFCKKENIQYYCGDENNVLRRYYECAEKFKLTIIIRVTSDCPLIDAQLIKKGLKDFENSNDQTYYSNAIKRSYPRGMDYEIFSFGLLKEAFMNADEESDKEHVTPFIWKNKSGNVTVKNDISSEDNSRFRLTLDTYEDQVLLTTLIEEHAATGLDCNGIVEVLKNNPELVEINKLIEQKKV